ncbi:MAG TPA: STAS domain-containing protein [Bryobacteraceae bacterium]|nr:STAS domain-containing protein [Bryobacteraceae bacterium]
MEQRVHLQIEQREVEGIVILDLKGRLVLGPQDVELRQRLQVLREAGLTKVALNLKDVSEMDSTALGTLIFCSMKFKESGGRLVFVNLSPSNTELSNTVKLNTAFDIYTNEIGAVNSFFPDRVAPHYDILEFVEELEQKRHDADLEAGKKHNGQASRESQELPK